VTTSANNSIEIVTHCWAGQTDIYAYLLRYQLSSLFSRTNDCWVSITVAYAKDDPKTVQCLKEMEPLLTTNGVRLVLLPLPHSHLFRRACGRNIAAKQTDADVVWFTDCDYLFHNLSLEVAIEECDLDRRCVYYPRTVGANIDELAGDRLIERSRKVHEDWFLADEKLFVPKHYGRAIGGIQIVSGDLAREEGYLEGNERSKPLEKNVDGFRSCRCDQHYRKAVGKSVAVDIPGVYRIRHTPKGRNL
jgi:hypothetical protein